MSERAHPRHLRIFKMRGRDISRLSTAQVPGCHRRSVQTVQTWCFQDDVSYYRCLRYARFGRISSCSFCAHGHETSKRLKSKPCRWNSPLHPFEELPRHVAAGRKLCSLSRLIRLSRSIKHHTKVCVEYSVQPRKKYSHSMRAVECNTQSRSFWRAILRRAKRTPLRRRSITADQFLVSKRNRLLYAVQDKVPRLWAVILPSLDYLGSL
jgi:hypothetical protein